MPSELSIVTRKAWADALEAEHAVDIPTLAREIMTNHRDLVMRESDRLIFEALKRDLKHLARNMSEQSQLNLFGFPSVIAIPVTEDDYHYVRTDKARWHELVAGKHIREENVRRAQEKLDAYQGALNTVRPRMEGTRLTFGEAFREQAIHTVERSPEDDGRT